MFCCLPVAFLGLHGPECCVGMLCQVSDFLMRVKNKRFPTIEKDMKMVLAHCGSLFLDPASLMQVTVPFK